ncbi:PilZ domain-containing protein [Sphingomonas rosea]
MNEFREKLFGSKQESPLLKTKRPRAIEPHEDESFSDLSIPRETVRQANHRDGDRHRLEAKTVGLVHDGAEREVTLINLSGGGAMIEGAGELRLWDRIELCLGENNRVEAAVRWIKGDRIGLEFAHETRIDLEVEELADTLRDVLSRSFPDVALAEDAEPEAIAEPAPAPVEENAPAQQERALRHPLIWSGNVCYNHDTTPVRLRNISAGGALIEGVSGLPLGAELLLDLDAAGAIFATVTWAHGDTAGLKFHAPYDLKKLAEARPEIAAARWVAPDYLRDDRAANSPWASQWGRSDLAGLQRSLRKPRF